MVTESFTIHCDLQMLLFSLLQFPDAKFYLNFIKAGVVEIGLVANRPFLSLLILWKNDV